MSTIIDRVKERLQNNKNWVCAVIGPVREGKSYTALRLAENIDPTFTVDTLTERCFFEVKTMLHFVNAHDDRAFFRGKCFILDEGGVAIGHREALSQANKSFANLLQSWGHLNSALFITSPSLSFLDKTARGVMLDNVFNILGHSKPKGICYSKVYDVKGNVFTGDGVRPFPHKIIDKEQIDIEGLRVHLPSKALREAYDVLSYEAKRQIGIRQEKNMEYDEKRRERYLKYYERKDKFEARNMFKKGTEVKDIAKEFGVDERSVQRWVKDLR